MKRVDAIVLGGGQGGIPLAEAFARQKKSVVLIDGGPLGGTCINNGCTPSKAFLAVAHAAGRARRARHIGLRGDVSVDFTAAMERVAGIVARFRLGIEDRLSRAGVTVVRSNGVFAGERIVRAGDDDYTAPLIVINTGARASIPAIDGLASVPYLTNATFFDQRDLPRRFGVIGGGYVGLELGQGMARAGSQVELFQRGTRLLPTEESDAVDVLQRSLLEDGMMLHLDANIAKIVYENDEIRIELMDGARTIVDRVLIATGRAPNAAELGVEKTGIRLDEHGYIDADEHFMTSCPGVYSIGDVAGQPAYTHVSWEDHRRLLDILAGGSRTRNDRVLAYSTFTEPQIARAGFSLAAALAQGINARAVTLELRSVARAIEWGAEDGFFRAVIDDDTGRLIGATFAGYEVAELIHVLLAHIERGSTWHDLDESVHVHPTFAEGLPTLARLFADSD